MKRPLKQEEIDDLRARIHPSLLEGGWWVNPGAPDAEEMAEWEANLDPDGFRRSIARLLREEAEDVLPPAG